MIGVKKAISSGLFAAMLGGNAVAIPLITNVPDWNGFTTISTWGPVTLLSFGQVFVPTGPETILDSFALTISSGFSFNYQAYVQQFNSTLGSTVGNILFESGVLTTDGTSAFQAVNVNTGGLNLIAGNEYIAYFSSSEQTGTGSASMGFLFPPPPNPNLGSFHYAGGPFNALTGPADPWLSPIGGQVAFSANLSAGAAAVPELNERSATVPFLLLSGLCLILGGRRKTDSLTSKADFSCTGGLFAKPTRSAGIHCRR